MTLYLQLQYRFFNRKCREFGIHPSLGILGMLIIFIFGSLYLYFKTNFASYLYILIAISILMLLTDDRRNDFLRITFGDKDYRTLRIIENVLLVVPFCIFLMYKCEFVESMVLFVTAILMTFISSKSSFQFVIPTPFSKLPFEFILGFRNTFYLFPLALILLAISIAVDNFNLGLGAIVFTFLIYITYYVKPENPYIVWNYNQTPTQFIISKFKSALFNASIISLPMSLILGCFFSEYWFIIALMYLISNLCLLTIILAKYSAYPYEMNLPQGLIFSLCIILPPMLIVAIPLFYTQSKRNLKSILA